MATGLDLVKSSMRKIGAITKNETPSADEANDGIEVINQMLSSWSNFASNVYARTLENFTLTGGDGEYTIGSGANFNTARPIKIIAAYIRLSNIDHPLEIVTDEDFAGISVKSQTGRPEVLNFDNGFANGTIKLWPAPDQAYTLYLLSEKPLGSVTLAGAVSFPPGWDLAIISNAAVLMAPEYGQPVTAELAELAKQSKASIKSAIFRNRPVDVPRNVGNSGNIFSGWC